MRFQLWSRDEYGQGSILMTTDDVEKIIAEGKKRATDANVNNALTGDDRNRNWDTYFPIVISESPQSASSKYFLYGGRGPLNKEVFYSISKKNGEVKEISLKDIPKGKLQMYLGDIASNRGEVQDWFASDLRGKPIESLEHQDLRSKVVIFIKVIK